jgi:ubiquitin carboxyl-terminal hydrolase 5/13
LKATTFSRQTEIEAWEQELTPCEHTLYVDQSELRKIESQGIPILFLYDKSILTLKLDLGHCSLCDLKENLWLCLHCGNLGCGRAQFGGSGGNSHGLSHFQTSAHPIAVKLGSITPDGTADIYCYSCNEERIDPELAKHLAHWGINIADREKTEKSLTELQIEQNLRWDFSMTTEDGKELEPLFGPGLTGLKNLGNSCYLSSVLQCLFDLPEFSARYYRPNDQSASTTAPAEDLETQLRKVADGLLSGRYSHPSQAALEQDSVSVHHQDGLAPAMLKAIIGKGHAEFSTMKQQDAFELLQHIFKLVDRAQRASSLPDPVDSFRFSLEQRLQCLNCKKVRYRTDIQDNISVPVPVKRLPTKGDTEEFEPVPLKRCLDIFTATEKVELTCPSCGKKDGFAKQSKFKTLPKNLAINARRFELINWVPTKLDIPVIVDDGLFSLDEYLSTGKQADEQLLPDDEEASAPAFVPNESAMSQLESMGFSQIRSENALYATGNSNAEVAMEWLFGHLEDPDIDIPVAAKNGSTTAKGHADPESISMLGAMGFSASHSEKALNETGGNLERAVEWLFSHPETADERPLAEPAPVSEPGSSEQPANYSLRSIVCHKGRSIHAG